MESDEDDDTADETKEESEEEEALLTQEYIEGINLKLKVNSQIISNWLLILQLGFVFKANWAFEIMFNKLSATMMKKESANCGPRTELN